MENLFLDDISKMNSDEIAVWLKKCRKEVKKEKYDKDEDYIKDVASFCMDWEKHYEKYKSTYESRKFKKAILSLGVLERKYNINCNGKLKEIEKPLFFDILSSKKEVPEFNKIKKDFDFWIIVMYIQKFIAQTNINYLSIMLTIISQCSFLHYNDY